MNGDRRPVTEGDLLAYVDNRLDPKRRAEVEAHLRTNPDDAVRVAADLAINAGLRRLFARVNGDAAGRAVRRRPRSRRRGVGAA